MELARQVTEHNELEERYQALADWSQAACVNPASAKKTNSVHRSQLHEFKQQVLRATVQNDDGSIIELKDPDGRIKLAFTGGTDDPSLELQLNVFVPVQGSFTIHPPKMIYKFGAFPTSKSDLVWKRPPGISILAC